MSIEHAIVEKLRELSADKQQEVLDFVEFLAVKARKDHSQANQSQGKIAWEAAQHQADALDSADNLTTPSSWPLRGKVLHYEAPFEPAVPLAEWDVLR